MRHTAVVFLESLLQQNKNKTVNPQHSAARHSTTQSTTQVSKVRQKSSTTGKQLLSGAAAFTQAKLQSRRVKTAHSWERAATHWCFATACAPLLRCACQTHFGLLTHAASSDHNQRSKMTSRQLLKEAAKIDSRLPSFTSQHRHSAGHSKPHRAQRSTLPHRSTCLIIAAHLCCTVLVGLKSGC
jgi:hypothetical protein